MGRILLVSIVVLSLAGCGSKGGKGVLSGKVTYKGQPVNGASLVLLPTSGQGAETIIPVSQEGTFSTTGVQPGEYKVIVKPAETGVGLPTEKELERMDPSKREAAKANLARMQQSKPTIPFPDKYKTHISSDLKLTVGKGEQHKDLDLKD